MSWLQPVCPFGTVLCLCCHLPYIVTLLSWMLGVMDSCLQRGGCAPTGCTGWSIGVCEGNGIYFLSKESEKEIKLYQYLIYRLILVPSLSLYVRGSSVTLCMWGVLRKGWVFHNVEGFTVAPLIVHLISAYYYVLQFVCLVK